MLLPPSTRLCFHSVCLFVSRIKQNYSTEFTRFGGKTRHRPWKNALDFAGYLYHIKLELGLGIRGGRLCLFIRYVSNLGWGVPGIEKR